VSFESSLQQAVYLRLSGFSGMPDVYDHVPQAADGGSSVPFPYVTLGDDIHVPFDTDDSVGSEATITLHTWSRARGRKEVKDIQATIRDALQRFELEVDGFALVTVEFDSSESFMDPDALTRHGVSRFRVLLDQT
jgi:hypothetical protein